MAQDLNYIIFWWLIFSFLGLANLPLTLKIFHKFWDKGYIFSKTISLALTTYIVFVLGVLKILPFTPVAIIGVALFLAVVNFFFFVFKKPQFLITLKKHYKSFIFTEIIFLIILIAWSFVRGFAPNIEGLEKFMDWGFINTSLRTKYMPPIDMWFASEPINYYYFGHLMFALLTKISGISSAITYNLSIATICALTFTSAFSIASNLAFKLIKNSRPRQYLIAGLVSALLLTFGGNLHSVYKISKINIETNNQFDLSLESITKSAKSYWYPDATRFIGFDPDTKDKTIHEFPIYSFVVADLHGHLNDVPIVLFLMAFLLAVSLGSSVGVLGLTLPVGLSLSIAYMTNAWDFAVYGLLFAISRFLFLLSSRSISSAFIKTFTQGLLTIAFWYLFTLPFSLNFTPMMEGIRLSDAHSPFYQLFILYGGFWLILLPFVIFVIFKNFKKLKPVEIFSLSLIICATLLIIIPEIVYIKDIYIYEHRRANTMFKLVYQAFIMYSLVSGFALIYLSGFLKKPLAFIYKIIFLLIFVIHLSYPYYAVKSYYGLAKYKGLWGLKFLQQDYPDNLNAINWLNQNIQGQPVILEAAGDSYTTYNQVSMATGLPTPQGWIVHEWLWRGGYDQPGARASDVQKIYESDDLDQVRQLLQKYGVQYIFVGTKEKEKYPQLDSEKFANLGAKKVFQSGDTVILLLD